MKRRGQNRKATDGETVPTYAYERRPQLFDGCLNWWWSKNPSIEQAPLVVLTGAGASIPAGIAGLGLPTTLTIAPGVTIAREDLVPAGGAGPGDVLDLETLLIVTDVLASLPRRIVHEGMCGSEALGRHRAVLGATVRMALPRLAGGSSLSSSFVDAVIERILALDDRHAGKVLDHLSHTIERGIREACLAIRGDALVGLYGPLLAELVALLEATAAPLVLPVFTTNYDETFAFLGDELRGELSVHVGRDVRIVDSTEPSPGHPGWRTFRPWLYRRVRPPQGGVTLVVFYLHGSIRWFQSAEAKPWFEVHASNASAARQPPDHRALLMPNSQKVYWSRSHASISRLLVPEGKDPFRPGAIYYPMRLSYLYLERCLRRCAALLAVGYSFRDSDCRELLADAWARRRQRPRLVLLDPEPAPILARLGAGAQVTELRACFDPSCGRIVASGIAPALRRGRSGDRAGIRR